MPLWNVYCAEGTYSNEDKRAFAEAITDIYAGDAGSSPSWRCLASMWWSSSMICQGTRCSLEASHATTLCASRSTISLFRCRPN